MGVTDNRLQTQLLDNECYTLKEGMCIKRRFCETDNDTDKEIEHVMMINYIEKEIDPSYEYNTHNDDYTFEAKFYVDSFNKPMKFLAIRFDDVREFYAEIEKQEDKNDRDAMKELADRL